MLGYQVFGQELTSFELFFTFHALPYIFLLFFSNFLCLTDKIFHLLPQQSHIIDCLVTFLNPFLSFLLYFLENILKIFQLLLVNIHS